MQDSIPLEHRQLAALRIESHQLSGSAKTIPALNFSSMRNVAAEVFCSTATYKCTKMEKRLDSLLKKITTNEGKLLAIALTAWVPAFPPAQQMQPEHLPPSIPIHANSPPDTPCDCAHTTRPCIGDGIGTSIYCICTIYTPYIEWYRLSCLYTHGLQQ